MFVKYMHLERYGNDEVDGIEQGTTYVFPKLDGTNAQVWLNEDGTIGAGSRNRTLSSGTTGVASVLTNRNFIGVERNKNYYDLSENRIKQTKETL